MSKRKQAEDFILKWIKKITKSDKNVQLYKDLFKRMNNKEFEEFMEKLEKEEIILNIIVPHDGFDGKITIEENYKLAKELGFDFFQHLLIEREDGTYIKTPDKYEILLLPFRRTKQTIDKGISVSDDAKRIDMLTGQVTGDSQASKLTYPELQVLVGLGLQDSLIELMRDRGGDLGAARALIGALSKYGRVSRKLIDMYSTGTLSTKSLKAYFVGMHLKVSL